MAVIRKFTIHGLAGREEVVSHVLNQDLNVFWGLNGSGKTSLFRILHSALRGDSDLLDGVPFLSAEVTFWNSATGALLKRSITQQGIGGSDPMPLEVAEESHDEVYAEISRRMRRPNNALWQTKVLDGKHVEDIKGQFRHSYLPISRISQTTVQEERVASYFSSFERGARRLSQEESFSQQIRRAWLEYNSASLSRIRTIQQQGLADILAVLFGPTELQDSVRKGAGSAEEAYDLVRNFLEDQRIHLELDANGFIQRYEEGVELQRVVAHIQQVTHKVATTLGPQNAFREIVEGMYLGNKSLRLAEGRGIRDRGLAVEVNGDLIPLESLSSGEKQLLFIMLKTLATEDTAVMIDEPELSLHVDWQRALIRSLREVNPSCQLILATHSPEILAGLDEKYVFEL